jgi:colanic acid biosynthesis glycosyl transferase WcaI
LKIRFFNTYEPVSPFYRDLLPSLVAQGFGVELIISRAEYRPGRVRLDALPGFARVKIHRTPALPLTAGRMAKLLNMAGYLLGAAGTLFRPHVDLNLFLTQPPLFAAWGRLLKRVRGQPYACLVMDLYPDVAVQDGFLKSIGWITKGLRRIAIENFYQAQFIIVIGRCMVDRLTEMGMPGEKIHFIPNWGEALPAQTTRFGNSYRRELGLQGKFVVFYSGNMGVSHDFDAIIAAACRLRDNRYIRFVFAGDGIRRKELETAKALHNLDNVLLLPYQPALRLVDSLRLGDIHFVSLRSGFEGLVVPSKAYGSLSAGRPILYQGDSQGEIARMVAENDIGAVIAPGDVRGLVEAILSYYEDPVMAQQQGQHARRLSETIYSTQAALQRYGELLFGSTNGT